MLISGPLIDVEGLAAMIGRGGEPLVVDCRHRLGDDSWGRSAWTDSHIPGAWHLHLDHDLSDRPKKGPRGPYGGRHPLPNPARFSARMRALGCTSRRAVVAYDTSGTPFAARLWWMMRWLGHPRVFVLEGGFRAWLAAGGDVDSEPPATAVGGTWQGKPNPAHCIDFATAGGGAYTLVDCRSPERYAGEVEPLDPVAGHIPGAVNRFWRDLLDGDRLCRAPSLPTENTAFYCGSGVTACVGLLALAARGLDVPPLYPGSWSDWVARGGAIATAEEER